ncbi:MAG: ABC transporter ATP-binding protein [Dehalococcoidales bacterium]|nr:ABC transporter ATP-binding protein [Dehalococcoidales bacterium]
MKLEIKNVQCGFGSRIIVDKFTMTVESGEILCLLGPNGVGKSTLFRTVLGLLKPMGGEILIDGKNIHTLPRKEFAKLMAYVPQAHNPPFPFRVLDVVVMGRTAHLGAFGAPGRHDRAIALSMLDRLGISFLADRIYTEISGGERQLVLIARALAQEPAFLMLDEPTSNLDFGNQVKVLQCVSGLAKEIGLGIIMTTHFPDHAFQTKGAVALMEWNNVFLSGNAEDIITAENMKDTYGIEIKVVKNTIEDLTVNSCIPVIRKP